MAIDDDIRLFSAVSLFKGLSPEHLRLLAFGSEHMALRAGRELFREGQPADCGYVVVNGEIELHSDNSGARESHGRFRRGALLGELALIAPGARPANATAATEAQVIRISRAAFMRVLGEYPDLAMALHRKISADFQGLAAKVARLGPSFRD